MTPFLRAVTLCLWLGVLGRPMFGAQFRLENQTLTVPDGFTVERVAGPGLVPRPITADFDEQGRLYVTDSSGTNDKVEKQLAEKPHRVLRLEDTDGDGVFDRSTVFADKMMFPEGCLWYRGSLYVSAPPSIWKLTDTDGDGIADRREEWLPAKTLTGCANDLHGPQLGPDGWIYWCKGAFAEQTYDRPGRTPWVTRAAHIFRARLDGSGVEPVLTGGMDNPVCIAFSAGGERFLTGTFFVHPGGGHRDGLLHAVYGGVYGKDHDVLRGHKRTGELMPIMTHHGPAASCFVLRVESTGLGAEYQDNLLACLFNLRKVVRHKLQPSGATFTTEDEDFLVSDNPDFHPTALVEDADGSLLVVDTGGWYKICCPTSQLWKPDVLGAIYRVRRTGSRTPADPRGLRISWPALEAAGLTELLGDERVAVRHRALDELALRGEGAVAALQQLLAKSDSSVTARRNAVWALTRMEASRARAAVREALQDADPSVRQAALHSISVWRDTPAAPRVVQLLKSSSPALQRTAAEALGRLGDPAAVQPLLALAGQPGDRVLEHSVTYALIELGQADALRKFLAEEKASPAALRAALIGLDQMDGGGLGPAEITRWLTSPEPLLRETASWLVGLHPEWARGLADFIRERLGRSDLSKADRATLEQHLASFAQDETIQELMGQRLSAASTPVWAKQVVLHAMAKASLKNPPHAWAEALASVLAQSTGDLTADAVSAARTLTFSKESGSGLSDALTHVAEDGARPAGVRLEALAALPPDTVRKEAALFGLVCQNLDSAKPVVLRSLAAGILGRAQLASEQLLTLAGSLTTVGPLELPRLLSAFQKGHSEEVGMRFLSALKNSPAVSSLRPDQVRPVLTNYPGTVRTAGDELLKGLEAGGDEQREHVDRLLSELNGGDVRRGQQVFNSQKAACSSCHAIGYLGGNVGPDLTRIGQIRTERDLVEAIAYPSASFVRSFEPLLVSTRSGDDYSGVVRSDSADFLVLATGPGAEVRIAKAEITDMRPGTVSVMPGGLEEQLSRQELADLIAFLKATRW